MTDDSESDTDFQNRLRTLIGSEKPYAWAARIGLSKGVFTGLWRMGSTPRLKTLETICAATGASMDWLLHGEGPPFVPSTEIDHCQPPSWQESHLRLPGTDDFSVDALSFKANWVRHELGAEPRDLALLRTTGDAMEPTLRPGDLILVDRRVREAREDAIYAIATNNALQIKRLQRLPEGGLIMRNDNPRYLDQTLDARQAASLQVLGRVVWAGRRF